MNNDVCTVVKFALEETFDVPFCVKTIDQHSLLIYPDNDECALFEVRITYRQTRIIVEISPQKYAVAMLEDISNSTEQQQKNFQLYVRYFLEIKAKIKIQINSSDAKPEIINWNSNIKKINIRITKIPVKDNMDLFDIKTEISEWAINSCGIIMSLLNIEKMEPGKELYSEGGISQVLVNKYERNPINRELCLKYNGYVCKICGFDFEKKYGKLGYHFIHVHHRTLISEMKEEYLLDPEKDLIPVCPNCHAMLHRENPPINPEELKEIIKNTDKEV